MSEVIEYQAQRIAALEKKLQEATELIKSIYNALEIEKINQIEVTL
jgi:hypothetical protein